MRLRRHLNFVVFLIRFVVVVDGRLFKLLGTLRNIKKWADIILALLETATELVLE